MSSTIADQNASRGLREATPRAEEPLPLSDSGGGLSPVHESSTRFDGLSRRRFLRTATAATAALSAGAVAPAAAALAEPDAELRRLWEEYLAASTRVDAAREAYRRVRDAYDAEEKILIAERGLSLPLSDEAARMEYRHISDDLWKSFGLDPLSARQSEATRALDRLADAIRRSKATTLFGIGVKLAALDDYNDESDLARNMARALADIDAITGEAFLASPGGIFLNEEADHLDFLDAEQQDEEDEEDEDEEGAAA